MYARSPPPITTSAWLSAIASYNRRTRVLPDSRAEVPTKTAPASSSASSRGTVTCSVCPFDRTIRKSREVIVTGSHIHPDDDTPGCTKQACDIRDAWGAFQCAGAVVLGVSPDSERSHAKFKAKYELPFPLLADPGHAVSELYEVWKEKSMYGRKYMGVERSTFVIGADGAVVRALRKVDPKKHADEVLALLGTTT